jgi:uncharacterized protein YcfJ
MNKQLLTGVGIGVAVAGMIGAVASYQFSSRNPTAPATELAAEVASIDASASETIAAEANSAAASAAPVPEAVAKAERKASVPQSGYALVLASNAATEMQRVAREECKDVQVERQKAIKDKDKIAGTAIGAVVGGVLGNQIGDGDGQKIATAAGAVAGGYAGRKIQENIQKNARETVTEKQCQTVYDEREQPAGYNVKIRVDGKVRTVRMATDPGVGALIPVNDSRLVARQ